MFSFITLIIEITILAIIKSMGIICVSNTFASLLIVLFSVSFIVSVQLGRTTRQYSMQILIGYSIRILLLYFDLFGTGIYRLPQSGADSAMFYRTSTELVLYGKTNRSSGFITFMYKVFCLIGINRLYGQFLLLLFSIAAIIIFVSNIDKLKISKEAMRRSVWLICLLPNFALLSSIFLRESIITLLLTISISFMIAWMDGGSVLCFMSAIVFSIAACFFHSGCIGITIGYIVCFLVYDKYAKRIHPTTFKFIITIIISVVLSYVLLRYGESLMGKFEGVNDVADIANTNQDGGSTYARYVGNSDNLINMVVFSIPRIVYFLFSPFPWQWRGGSDIIAFIFSSLYYLITIRNVIVYFHKGNTENKEKIICLLIIAFICTFIFAWGVSNTGTASRHRDKMVCLYGVLYALTVCTSDIGVHRKVNCNNLNNM